MAFFPVRPFWNDEWRLIYNLKFKNISQLWGTLDLLQQCPRVYLTMLKKINSSFDYSYTSMRLPALITSVASILFVFYLKRKIFPVSPVYGCLFVLILISSQTFTDYLVQVKQYEMEIFLCLLALWQLMTLLEICKEGPPGNKYKYLLLCFSFLAAPFFSYTYPIAVTPVFLIIILNSVISLKNDPLKKNKAQFLLSLYLPLAIVSVSILIFYWIDVKQLMADNRMYLSYRRMLGNEKGENHFIENFWKLFALVGSGLLYEIIFGILGIASFFYGIYNLSRIKKRDYTTEDHFKLYGILLLGLTLCLFLSGKLMGSVARLTAFTVPSISILIVSFFRDLKEIYSFPKLADTLATILFIGLFGNIISTCINTFTYPEYHDRIETYWHISQALKQARLSKIPILFTDGVRGVTDGIHGNRIKEYAPVPGKVSSHTITPEQIAGADTLCAEVILKVNPEYKVWDSIPVYLIPDMKWTDVYMNQLPVEFKSAIATDGINFIKLTR